MYQLVAAVLLSMVISTGIGISVSMDVQANGPEVVGDAATLHNNSCQSCHDNGIYSRKNSIIHSYSGLTDRVKFCDTVNNVNWSETQVESVVNYLNEAFYHFPKL